MDLIPHKNFLRVEKICDPIAVPISANRGHQFQHYGMGMLFKIDSDVFLVTCRHVIANAANDGLELWVRDAAKAKLRRISAEFFVCSSPKVDIAVAQLSRELAKTLNANRFVTQGDLCHSHQPLGIPCVMHGILSDLSARWDANVKTTDVRLKPASFVGRTTGSTGLSTAVDDEVHFLLYASNRFTANVSKEKMELATLNASFGGLSGTPIVAVDGAPFKKNWNPVDTKIIGFQSSVVQFEQNLGHDGFHEYMKVVRIEFLHYLLSEAFPAAFRKLTAYVT